MNFVLLCGKKNYILQFYLNNVLFVVLKNSWPLWLNCSRYGERAYLDSDLIFIIAYFHLTGGKTEREVISMLRGRSRNRPLTSHSF